MANSRNKLNKTKMKKLVHVFVLFLLFCSIGSNISFGQDVKKISLQGYWQLTNIEGNDTVVRLTPAELEKSKNNYTHDFPLKSTTLDFNGDNTFTMTHHVGGIMYGTFNVTKDLLTLHAGSCTTCHEKDFYFFIRKQTSQELILDIFEEDEGSTSYVRLTFAFVNNQNKKL